MNTTASCRNCGDPLTGDARGGVCPRCLFNMASVETIDLHSSAPSPSGLWTKPDPRNIVTSLVDTDPADTVQEPILHSFGDYELMEEIARGGMGVVYKARQKSLGRVVALKFILAGQFAGKQIAQRFKSEAIAAAVLQHPNIVAVHEVGVHNGLHFFSMDYVEGQNLAELVDKRPLGPREAARYVKLIAGAIHYAHGQGILHRDLKPSNVLVDAATNQPRVTDFGLAKRLDAKTSLTVTGEVMGSPHFMSPEQAGSRRGNLGRATDVFGLGGILYFLLTARAPFQGETLESTIEQVLNANPVAPRLLNPTLPRDLETICLKCLEKAPERRYRTAQELADELDRFIRDEPILARPISQAEKAWRWCRRKPLVASLSATTLALLISVAIGSPIALFQIDQQRQNAELAREENRRRAYAAEMSAAFQALQENNLQRAIDLINRQRPTPEEEDLRGFEWRHLWQLCQSQEKATFHDEGGIAPAHGGGSPLAYSPDGQWLVSGGRGITIRKIPSRNVVRTIPIAAATLAFSPTEKLMAGGDASHVRLWSTESWNVLRSLPNARSPCLFSPDGRWLITGTSDGYRIWNTEVWKPAGFCAGKPTYIWQSYHAVAFSPDGRLLVTAGHPKGRDAGQFQVWDFPSLTARTNFAPLPFSLGATAFTPDGKHLFIGDFIGGRLMIWDVAEGRVVQTLHEHTGGITAIVFASDGQTFATSGCDRTLLIWDTATRKVLVRLRGHLEEVWSVAISPDGSTIASRTFSGTTKLWDATVRPKKKELSDHALIAGFSADSRSLVVQGFDGFKLWRHADGDAITVPLSNFAFRGTYDTWADVHGIEPYAVFGRTDGTVEYWNLATMSRVASWRVTESEVSTATFSPNGQLIATTDTNGNVQLWQTKTGREIRRLPAAGEKLQSVIFSPDGRLLAGSTPGDHPRVYVWEIDAGRLLLKRRIDRPNSGVVSIAFSPDSKLLATPHWDNSVRLWEIPSGTVKSILKGHIQGVFAVAFSPDGKTLATSGDDRRVKLWNLATLQEVATLEPLTTGACRSIRFSPDGRTLAVGHYLDPKAYTWLWEVPSFNEIAAMEAGLNP